MKKVNKELNNNINNRNYKILQNSYLRINKFKFKSLCKLINQNYQLILQQTKRLQFK